MHKDKMRYLILLILILFLISGEVYAEKTTCRSIQKNPFHEIVTVTTFWGHYRGYIFEKTGEVLDLENNKIMERIPDYIKKKCKINKRINIFNELVFQGIKDEFKVKQKLGGSQKVELFFKRIGVEGKRYKCLSRKMDSDIPIIILTKWRKLEELSGGNYKNEHFRKVF